MVGAADVVAAVEVPGAGEGLTKGGVLAAGDVETAGEVPATVLVEVVPAQPRTISGRQTASASPMVNILNLFITKHSPYQYATTSIKDKS